MRCTFVPSYSNTAHLARCHRFVVGFAANVARMMRRFVALAGLMFACATRGAAAADRPLLVPIHTFVAAVNAGNRAQLISAFTGEGIIADEFAPFTFPAPNAARHWFDGFGADQQASGVSGAVISVRPPKFATVAGAHAYVVIPTIYTYRLHGKPAQETGSLAFTLLQRGSHWKIATMSWAKLTDTSVP